MDTQLSFYLGQFFDQDLATISQSSPPRCPLETPQHWVRVTAPVIVSVPLNNSKELVLEPPPNPCKPAPLWTQDSRTMQPDP